MKKISTLILAFAFVGLAGMNNEAKAQQEQGQIVVSAGVGWGLLSGFFSIFEDVKVVHPINAMVDYGVTDNFSVGAAYTYSSFAYNENWFYTDTAGLSQTESVDIKATRMNFGVRPLFHFGDNDAVDTYTGARIGYTAWNYTDNSSFGGTSTEDIKASSVSFQALFGVRTYFNDVLGAHFEIGVGTAPYFIAGGISARF